MLTPKDKREVSKLLAESGHVNTPTQRENLLHLIGAEELISRIELSGSNMDFSNSLIVLIYQRIQSNPIKYLLLLELLDYLKSIFAGHPNRYIYLANLKKENWQLAFTSAKVETVKLVGFFNINISISEFFQLSNIVVVIGSYHTGKSVLINALLGRKVIPVSLVSTNKPLIRLQQGFRERYFVRYIDSTIEIKTGNLDDYETFSYYNHSFYQSIEVFIDNEFLNSGLEILYIPTLNSARMRDESVNYFLSSLIVVYVMNCQTLFSRDDREFLSLLNEAGVDYVIALNKTDGLSGIDKQNITNYMNTLRHEYNYNSWYLVSAKQALEGNLERDSDKIAGSGIITVQNDVLDLHYSKLSKKLLEIDSVKEIALFLEICKDSFHVYGNKNIDIEHTILILKGFFENLDAMDSE